MEVKEMIPDFQGVEDIARLYCQCFTAPDKGENWTIDSAIEYFEDRIGEDSVFFIIKEKEKLVAVLCGSDFEKSFISKETDTRYENCFYISLIAISPERQRKGIGLSLLTEGLKKIKSHGYESVLARCRADNVPVQHLFLKSGFKRTGREFSELGGVRCERFFYLLEGLRT